MLRESERETLCRIARAIAAQFGSNCEVVVHEISECSTSNSIIAIENGHVSGRKLGDMTVFDRRWCWSSWGMTAHVRRIICAI